MRQKTTAGTGVSCLPAVACRGVNNASSSQQTIPLACHRAVAGLTERDVEGSGGVEPMNQPWPLCNLGGGLSDGACLVVCLVRLVQALGADGWLIMDDILIPKPNTSE
jgi:hypothetical protein